MGPIKTNSRLASRSTARSQHAPDTIAVSRAGKTLRPSALALALHGVIGSSLAMGLVMAPEAAHAQASGANSAAATALPQGHVLRNFQIAAGPQSLQPLLQKPSLTFVALIIVMAFLLAIFL